MPSPLDATDARGYTRVFEYNASKQPVYIGYAKPGTGKDKPGWRIEKHTYTANVVTDIQYAEGDNGFNYVWNDRTGYSYS